MRLKTVLGVLFLLTVLVSTATADDHYKTFIDYYSNGEWVGWTRWDCYGHSTTSGQQTESEIIRFLPCPGSSMYICPDGVMGLYADGTGPFCGSSSFIDMISCSRIDFDSGICELWCPPGTNNTAKSICIP